MFTNPDALTSRVAQHVDELHADATAARQARAAARRHNWAADRTRTDSERVRRLRRLTRAAATAATAAASRVAHGVLLKPS